MNFSVVDTNVAIVANGKSHQAGPACVLSCIYVLEELREQGVVLLDDKRRILYEYMQNLSMSGQPGAGDYFMKWVWSMQANPEYCQQVTITPLDSDPKDFLEFPRDPELTDFDRSDRKFVAVALSSQKSPDVLNAVDTDWANHFEVLSRCGIRIKFLCPQHVNSGR